ncbi:formate dehydrogenase, partial [Shewanella sp. 0m-11]
PLCAEFCSTKSLLAGDALVISNIFRERSAARGAPEALWGYTPTTG